MDGSNLQFVSQHQHGSNFFQSLLLDGPKKLKVSKLIPKNWRLKWWFVDAHVSRVFMCPLNGFMPFMFFLRNRLQQPLKKIGDKKCTHPQSNYTLWYSNIHMENMFKSWIHRFVHSFSYWTIELLVEPSTRTVEVSVSFQPRPWGQWHRGFRDLLGLHLRAPGLMNHEPCSSPIGWYINNDKDSRYHHEKQNLLSTGGPDLRSSTGLGGQFWKFLSGILRETNALWRKHQMLFHKPSFSDWNWLTFLGGLFFEFWTYQKKVWIQPAPKKNWSLASAGCSVACNCISWNGENRRFVS